MASIPESARTVVVVFKMAGCGPCGEYLPRFRRVAKAYPSVPTVVVDVNDPDGLQLAQHFGVQNTPTTMVMKRGDGHRPTVEGALDEADIHRVFSSAIEWGRW